MSKKNQHRSKKAQQPKKQVPLQAEEQVTAAEPVVEAEAAPVANGTKAPKAKRERSSVGMQILKFATAAVVVLVLFWFGFTTVVKEGNCAVILRFGAVREEITDAGLYFKLPWPFESVVSGNTVIFMPRSSSTARLRSKMASFITSPFISSAYASQ